MKQVGRGSPRRRRLKFQRRCGFQRRRPGPALQGGLDAAGGPV